MKLFKLNLPRISTVALMIFFILGLGGNGFATQVEIIRGQLFVNGEPFTIKGVNYSPIPIGVDPEVTPPYGDYFTPNYSPIYERDLPLLRDMGANTIRLWAWNNGNGHTDFLDKAYDNGVKPIYVIISFSMDPSLYPDISSPDAREKIKADFRVMVAAYKNHPAVLMWSIGNELNSPKMYGDKLSDLFSLINEMAHVAHREEGAYYHPVTTPLADIDLINTIGIYDPLMTDLDIWGANIYRGSSFGTFFNDFKAASKKPLLIIGFGIDAYDENAEDEYENVGKPYQATYAESLWKEITANLDVCLGGLVRAYSDEWWLGKFGNTLGGCPDPDPAVHSPCGHPSNSDPDGFVNYEWFGIMRAAKNGSNLDIMEPRKIYDTLKSLWTEKGLSEPQLQSTPEETFTEAELNIPKVLQSVKPLDLTRTPTIEDIMAAGQLGGPLYPTHRIADKNRENEINLSFGEAIQEWNKHKYKEAIQLFKNHVEQYPDSPWASEAVLHIGCDAYYNGRLTEAETSFKWILDKNKDRTQEGAKTLVNKAKVRLAILKVYQNNFEEARQHFSTLIKESSDWRDRTYASHWIQRLSRYTSKKLAMLNCGTRALAYLLEKEGKEVEARKVMGLLPETVQGHSIKDLSDISSRYGYNLAAIRVSASELKELPLPAMMHINVKNQGDSGHYWILDKMIGDTLELFDPQSSLRFQQTVDQFSREWNGNALVFSDEGKSLPGIKLAENETEQIYGGCCGQKKPEDNQGNPGRNQGPRGSGSKSSCGSPAWSVNMINMNLYVQDIPLWYSSAIGPSVGISLSYNSQSATAYNEPFGNKWQFNYASYLTVDTGGNVTIFMPDGRRDEYSPHGLGGYYFPYQAFNTLTKIAENYFELKFPDDTVFVYKIPPGTSSLQPFLVEIRDPHVQKLTFGYDSNVRLTTITDALSRITTLTYNAQGLVTQATDPFGRFATFEYDANRNLVKITDMGGYASSLSYDKDAYVTSIEKPSGKWGFYIEPASGVLAYSDDYAPPGEHMWQSYRITITNPVGDKEEYFYHGGCGNAVGINACGYSWYISPKDYVPYTSGSVNNFITAPKTVYYLTRISSQGGISKITDFEGDSISYGYDGIGNRTSIQDGNGNTTSLVYDTKGNITMITDPVGNGAQFTYDSSNNLTKLTDPAGNVYSYEYNGTDLTKITDPKNGVTSFTYNSYGKVTQLKDGKNNSISYTYDSFGNLIKTTNPVGGTDSYTYDAKGRVISHTDPKGNTKSFKYDGVNRIIEVQYPDQSVKTYNYDCCALSTITESTGTLNFLYDDLKRLTSFTDVYGKTISYGYDKAGSLTTLTYPDGKIVHYEYDKADRLTKVTDWLNNVTSYEYDSAGNLIRTINADGSIILHEYDNANRLKSILDYGSNATVNAIFRYTLNSLGNRTAISFYQPLNVIPSTQNTNYTYNTDNRLLTAGAATFNYDNNGNLMTKTIGSSVTNYGSDYNDMLTQVVTGADIDSYRYDGLGNRIAKIENSVETRYIIDARASLNKILAETDTSGSITVYYVYGLGLISKITLSGQAYYYHYDGIGSTIALTGSSGNIVNKYSYDAFGKVTSQAENVPNPFKYVGRFGVMDEKNGLLYMKARYYDPEVGRFTNKDPIGLLGGLNMYSYVENNPVLSTDPYGESDIFCKLLIDPEKKNKYLIICAPIEWWIKWMMMKGYKKLTSDEGECIQLGPNNGSRGLFGSRGPVVQTMGRWWYWITGGAEEPEYPGNAVIGDRG